VVLEWLSGAPMVILGCTSGYSKCLFAITANRNHVRLFLDFTSRNRST
jgi:hypothetical protein